MDLSIGSLIIYAVIGWIIGQIMLGVIDGWQIAKLRENVEIIKEISERIHQVKIEKIGETEYWYDQDNDQFLGQGKTFDEIVSHIKSRFPDHIFILEGKGGFAAQTNWQLAGDDELKKIKLN